MTTIEGEVLPAAAMHGRGTIATPTVPMRDRIASAWLLAQESPNTQSAYRRDIRAFFDWCDEFGFDALTATRQHLDGYRTFLSNGGAGRMLSGATIKRKLAALSSFYRYGCLEHPVWVPGNPMDHVRRPRIADVATSTWLTGDEVDRLFTVADERGLWEGALVRILCYTGIRVSELCNARSSDLRKDGADLTLAVTRKGGERHRVVLPADAETVLREHLGGRPGPLFIGRHGEAVGRDEVAYQLGKLVRAAGIDKRITPHCLRHTAATLAREAGRDIRAVQQLLGHKRIETTMRYEHARLATSDSAAHDIARHVGRGEQ